MLGYFRLFLCNFRPEMVMHVKIMFSSVAFLALLLLGEFSYLQSAYAVEPPSGWGEKQGEDIPVLDPLHERDLDEAQLMASAKLLDVAITFPEDHDYEINPGIVFNFDASIGYRPEEAGYNKRATCKSVFLPNLCVMHKILSSEYQSYACGKILSMP